MDYIDPRMTKTFIPNKGYGFIASETIPSNTVIIKETPETIIEASHIHSDIFQLLHTILNNKQLSTKFIKLQPKTLQFYPINKARILTELKSLKAANSKIYHWLIDNFSTEEILLYCAKYMCNAFQFNDAPVILFIGTILNHSCLPNVILGRKTIRCIL
jgi:hypothetical protein